MDCDYIVIGSGFGGSVAALRLSQKGYRVKVLEAGRRWTLDDFPTTSWQTRRTLWAPRLGCYGPLQIHMLRHALVLSGVGVGGGSLIYGNTLYEPLDSFFQSPPIQALGGDALKPYFDLARRMMGVCLNPHLTPMDEHLRQTAAEYGRADTFNPSPVAVFFGPPGLPAPDPYFDGEGPERAGCTACGGCFLGCRVGAKNTLDRNYLHLAERLGCEIHPNTRVERIVPLPQGGFAVHTRAAEGWRPRRRTFTAPQVVLAAGVMGTLRLLLDARRRGDLPDLSPALGQQVRTNSEAVVVVRCRDPLADHSRGLAASSSVFPDPHTQVQIDRYPAGSDSVAALATLMIDGDHPWPRPLRLLAALARSPVASLRALWPAGFARQSAFLVVMQDLDSRLRLRLRRRLLPPFPLTLRSEADGAPPATWIPIAHDFARKLAARLDATPLSSAPEVLLNAPTTAHILGGCSIGPAPDLGVVGPDHQLFGHPGLTVCDGSVIPVNLGVNPALTILALSERAMARVPLKPGAHLRSLAAERRWGTEHLLLERQSL